MKRLTFALLAACAAGVGSATIVFSDGFETGNFNKWTEVAGATLPTISSDPARVRTGQYSAHVSGVVPSAGRYRADFDSLGQPIVRLSAWHYESMGPAGTGRQFLALNSFHAATLRGLWAIGTHNSVLAPGVHDPTRYQARIVGAGAPEWFNLTTPRVAGWRHFQIEVTPTHSRFFVDGVLGAETARFGTLAVNRVWLNSGLSAANNPAWVDDVTVEAVPEPASLLVLGAGALALLRRRKR